MGSLNPSDSASHVPCPSVTFSAGPRSPGEDVVAVIEALKGIPGAGVVEMQAVLKSWSGAYHAYLRKYVTPVGSAASSTVQPSQCSSVVESRASASGDSVSSVSSKVAHWRGIRRGVSSPSRAGYCYLMAIRPERRPFVSAALGQYPTFSSLLQLPVSDVVSVTELDSMFVVKKAGACHLRAVPSGDTVTLRTALAEVNQCVVGHSGVLSEIVGVAEPSGLLLSEHMTLGGPSDLYGFLSELLGLPDGGQLVRSDVLLLTKSAAMHSAEAKARVRMFEAVGDAALTHVLSRRCLALGKSVQQYQAARSACSNNGALSRLFVNEMPQHMFSFPSDVPVGTGVVGAKTLEAIIGCLDVHYGMTRVEQFVHGLGLLRLAGGEYADCDLDGEVRVGASDGFCYLTMIRESSQRSVALRCGANPRFMDLLDLGAAEVKSISDLQGLSVVRVMSSERSWVLAQRGEAAYHIEEHAGGMSLLLALGAIVAQFPGVFERHSFGESLSQWFGNRQFDTVFECAGSDRLGAGPVLEKLSCADTRGGNEVILVRSEIVMRVPAVGAITIDNLVNMREGEVLPLESTNSLWLKRCPDGRYDFSLVGNVHYNSLVANAADTSFRMGLSVDSYGERAVAMRSFFGCKEPGLVWC